MWNSVAGRCAIAWFAVVAVFGSGPEIEWSTARSTRRAEAVTLVVNWPFSVVPENPLSATEKSSVAGRLAIAGFAVARLAGARVSE